MLFIIVVTFRRRSQKKLEIISEKYNFFIRPDYQQGGIEILREKVPQMMILIKLTSTKWRESDQEW